MLGLVTFSNLKFSNILWNMDTVTLASRHLSKLRSLIQHLYYNSFVKKKFMCVIGSWSKENEIFHVHC